MNKLAIIIVLGVLLVGGSIVFLNKNRTEEIKNTTPPPPVSTDPRAIQTDKEVDYTAGFAIFTNGTFRIFTSPMYHNQSDDVFIESNNPNVVHVKKSNVTWEDFFKTLPFKLTKECLTTGTGETFCTPLRQGSAGQARLKFYLNGTEDPSVLDKQINIGDKLLVTYGNENLQQIQDQLQKIPVLK